MAAGGRWQGRDGEADWSIAKTISQTLSACRPPLCPMHSFLPRRLVERRSRPSVLPSVRCAYLPQALREMVPSAERATQTIYPSSLLSPIESKVRKTLKGLIEQGKVTGCQVQ